MKSEVAILDAKAQIEKIKTEENEKINDSNNQTKILCEKQQQENNIKLEALKSQNSIVLEQMKLENEKHFKN